MMRRTYMQALEDLHAHLTANGKAVVVAVKKAIKAYNTNDKELAHELFSDDLRINAATADLDRDLARIVALQQPVADDLRMIFAALYINRDFERIGDHAVTIARTVLRNKGDAVQIDEVASLLDQMGAVAQDMVEVALDSFKQGDAKAALKAAQMDQEIDELIRAVYQAAKRHMRADGNKVESGLNAITVANSLERIGDYMTNICEAIIYLHQGDIMELN